MSEEQKQTAARKLAAEGALLVSSDPLKAREKAESALRFWPECPEAVDLMRKADVQIAAHPELGRK